jgi:hypothetical protein
MGRATRWLLVAVLWGAVLALGSAGGAATEAAGPEGSFVPWVPSESWEGGRQYDPRLERAVRFWGAGMPLREVFAGVKEQTGVEIGFWPAGDVNERICVTLYLNAEKPPTLRELMAQLSWVTDCGFGYDAREGAARYSLLSTSVAQGATEKLREERVAASAAREEARLSAWRDLRDRVLAAVEECRSAVGLSQGELVRRYRGRDDVLLLALLDPRYRAGMKLALSVPRAELESALSVDPFAFCVTESDVNEVRTEPFYAQGWKWCELTREQRDAVGVVLDIREEEACWDDARLTDAALGAGHEVRVGLGVSDLGRWVGTDGLGVGVVWRDGPGVEDVHARGVEIPLLLRPGSRHAAATDLRIRRLLGENVTHLEIEPVEESYWESVIEQDRATALRAARRAMAEHRALSEEAEGRLAGLRASVPLQTAYSLWQIQEAGAAASGMHVVSDCFWQAEQSIDSMRARFPRGDTPRLSMLDVLTLYCGSTGGVDPFRPGGDEGEWTAAQEWGDAGEFLRFRSLERALWREAFLPEAVLSAADSHLEAVLAESSEAGREVRVPVSVRELARIAVMTTEQQQHVGGWVIYGDPTDAGNAYRRPYLRALLRPVWEKRSVLGALVALSDEEWASVEGEGLHDVSVELRQGGQRAYMRFDVVRLVPLSMCPTPELAEWWAENWTREQPFELEAGVWDASERVVLYAVGEGRTWVELFPSVLRVESTSTERLVEPPHGRDGRA